ncbi:hypothetical protein HYPSUDRAFT_57216 [Hypholoma sublateritium FD-334 SS-4]|uniref:MYND-type domain-containing protein n=1 Tax=Hypholoma sublateritium (strain FD-334 SS-4) TaxID=945553 RepID=A0A0D2KUE8_HYPSF|nr:hypothetical protein HYPSUDRAFT_57216 [Hypholoma sublateritium FD-334 SS-4]
MDIIGEVLCSLSEFENVREAIADTPGAIELATRIWVVEDTCPVPTTTSNPVNTSALEVLLSFLNWFNPPNENQPHHQFMDPVDVDEEVMKGREILTGQRDKVVRPRLDRVVSAAGGISRLVDLAFSRLQAITANVELIRGTGTAVTLDLISQLCRSSTHPLRFKFLDKGLISLVVGLAVTVVGMLDVVVAVSSNGRRQITSNGTGTLQGSQAQQRFLQYSLVSCFTLLFNMMESTDGHTWFKEAVSAGLLQAWVDAAAHIHNFSPEDAEVVVEIMSVLLPKYTVFESVINSVNGALKKIKHEARLDACRDPQMKKAWTAFRQMTAERSTLDRQCQNLDAKKTFMRCGGCSQALYCSRDCQKDDWRAGHKRVCNLTPQERLEIYQTWKSNDDHFHRLVVHDAIRHLATIKRLAESAYPLLAESPTSFVITIDYLVYPPKLGVHLLLEHWRYALRHTLKVGPTAELHNDEMIQRSLNNPGKYGIIQSKRSEGDVLEAKWGALDQLVQQVG